MNLKHIVNVSNMKFEKFMKLLYDKKHMIVAFALGWLIASSIKIVPIIVLIIFVVVDLYHTHIK